MHVNDKSARGLTVATIALLQLTKKLYIRSQPIMVVIVELNDRPRKTLNYKTLAKLMAEHMVALAAMHFEVESA